MAIKTYDEYLARIKKLKRNVYIAGEKVDRTEYEGLSGSLRVVKETYDRAR